MAKPSSSEAFIGFFRRNDLAYRLTRSLWRRVRSGATALLRLVSPHLSFLGMPQGTFSLAEQVCSGEADGCVFFEQQEVRAFGLESLVKRAGLNQDGFQPWAVFWAKVEHAHLTGPNLLLLDKTKHACAEAMFGAEYARFDASYIYNKHG